MSDHDLKQESGKLVTQRICTRHLLLVGGAGLLGVALAGYVAPTDARVDSSAEAWDKGSDHNETNPSRARVRHALPLPAARGRDAGSALSPAGSVRTIRVAPADTLSGIFSRQSISRDLAAVLNASGQLHAFDHLRPGDTLTIGLREERLQTLRYHPVRGGDVLVRKMGKGFVAQSVQHHYEHRQQRATGSIQDSLFAAGQQAGLPGRLIMQLARIFSWDIDFALDLRPGDNFTVVYDTLYENGVQVREGDILAAEFVSRGQRFQAVRYTDPSGRSDYYTPAGRNLRKAFLRTPVQFTRISSVFNLHRHHPILNQVRAHTGVDYAAPTGTPVRAAGDGRVTFAGWRAGYGHFIILQHSRGYCTAYGHLSRYAAKLRSGARVRQGQIIGYVGQSGLATGPHLHYEFRVDGRHVDPLKVRLPRAQSLPDRYRADFRARARPLLAQIDTYRQALLDRPNRP